MKISYKTREAMAGYGFISLWLVGFLVFTLIPIGRTFWFSLNEVKVTADGIKANYIGFLNYRNAFLMDVNFSGMLVDYGLQMLIYVPVITVFSVMMAILLNTKIKGKKFFRGIFFLPVIITSGPVIKQLIDQGATTFPGLQQYFSLTELQKSFPPAVASLISFLMSSFIMILWYSGVQILIFLSGLQKIDPNVYEAASIDGASKWQLFWKLTLPSLKPMVLVNIIYTVVTISVMSISPIVGLIQQDMYDSTLGLGYSAALSWIYFIAMLLMMALFIGIFYQRRKKRVSVN